MTGLLAFLGVLLISGFALMIVGATIQAFWPHEDRRREERGGGLDLDFLDDIID